MEPSRPPLLATLGYGLTIWYLTSVWHSRVLQRRLLARTDLGEAEVERQLQRMRWGVWTGHSLLISIAGVSVLVGLAEAGLIDPRSDELFRDIVTLLGVVD